MRSAVQAVFMCLVCYAPPTNCLATAGEIEAAVYVGVYEELEGIPAGGGERHNINFVSLLLLLLLTFLCHDFRRIHIAL